MIDPVRISVIGAGYLGATHAAGMAEIGCAVTCIDVDPARIDALGSGRAPFYEPGLDDIIARNLAAGRLRFTTDWSAIADLTVHFICVGTPELEGSGQADLRQVHSAIDALVPRLHGAHTIIGKSTVPVGTTRKLAERANALKQPGASIEFAWNPEFLREGKAVEDTLRPTRIVVGVESDLARAWARRVYQPLIDVSIPYIETDFETAELVKVAANSYLATRISFINAVAELCEAAGADITSLRDALSLDPRIGAHYFAPGLGFGGSCLPKDIRAFAGSADDHGVPLLTSLLRTVDAINREHRERAVRQVIDLLGGDAGGRKVAVLGLSFKPETDDVRDSPALGVAERLHQAGAWVQAYDPVAMANAALVAPHLGFFPSALEAIAAAELVVVATDWAEFRSIDPDEAKRVAASAVVLDCRAILDHSRWESAGWDVHALGQPGANVSAGTTPSGATAGTRSRDRTTRS